MFSSSSRPIVVTGMHRSGTSLVASYLSSLGIDMGDRLLAADAHNPHGYFEDTDFRELQGKILIDSTPDGVGGHRDWGWTENERLDRECLARWTESARALAATRSSGYGLWGWKDPRTTLLLEFWDEILDREAFYVLLYRFPWEVADSMQRLGTDVFLEHPEYAYRIWTFYNQHLLDFHRRHPDRSLLVSTNSLLQQPERLASLMRGKFGIAVEEGSIESLRDRDLFHSLDPADPLISLVAATSPQCTRLLADLDRSADLPADGLWQAGSLRGERLSPAEPVDVSVVIPCYNLGETLIEAVASVERTAPERCELIVVNDGSSQPRTLEVLEVLRKGGYYVVDQPNTGLASARNRGIREARGRYVLPLDADNRLAVGYIQSAIRLLDSYPEVGVCYGDWLEFGTRNGRKPAPEFDLPALLWSNYIDACAVYRREIWEACGGYDAGAPAWEDWDFWISAAERGWRFHRLPDIAFEYRVRPNSMLRNAEREGLRRTVREHIYRKHHSIFANNLVETLLAGHTSLNAASADALAVRESRDQLQREIDLLAATSGRGRETSQISHIKAARKRITDESQIKSMIARHTGWYHCMELSPGIITPGVNDSTANLRILDHLGLPADCSGLRVLDIGTADGFMAFEMEKRGADEVVGLDYRKPTSTGFAIASAILGSRVRHVVENVYELDPEKTGLFDIVLFLGVLYHLRNPLLAFDRIRSIMKPGAFLFVETQLLDNSVPLFDGSTKPLEEISQELRDAAIWQFYSKGRLNDDLTNKWVPNMAGLKDAIEDAEFEILDSHIGGARGSVKARAIADGKTAYYRNIDSAKSI
jgi:GT2 family glycosyltransferase/2-polyprenyl-3-methyl-5-hydroxy-6-metoxy-1,4-benzoquinol methylase